MAKHLLTDRDCVNAKPNDTPKAKPYRLNDGEGLTLYVAPTGVKSWQLRYSLDGKKQTATLGKYPSVSLKRARELADEKRAWIAQGKHPTVVKRLSKLKQRTDRANTFGVVAADWIEREARRKQWTPKHRTQVEASIANHLADLENVPVAELVAPTLAPLLRRVELRAPLMLEKVRPRLDAILDYAVEHGIIAGNPLPAVRRSVKVERKHYPAITELPAVGTILRTARATDTIVCKAVQRAHHLLVQVALRVSEVLGAEWTEFQLDGVDRAIGNGRYRFDKNAGNWTVPRERMKRKDAARGPHVVPLPPQLLALLRQWRDEDGKDAIYVCPTPRDPQKHITPEAMEKHYRRILGLAGKHSPHSWRAAFKSICSDAGKDADVIEAQLDHVVGNKVAAAYDRATRLELRRELLTWYERTLIAARDGAEVFPMQKSRKRA